VAALDPGLFHLAAAQLAVDHFNSRNATIVQTIDALTRNCPITFRGTGQEPTFQVVDTGVNSHQAMQHVVENHLLRYNNNNNTHPRDDNTNANPLPRMVDAIAGPYHDIPALDLSVLATGLQSPMVAYRSVNPNLLEAKRHPYFSQVGADALSEMKFIQHYLQHILGKEEEAEEDLYVAIVYSAATTSILQKAELLRTVLLEQQARGQRQGGGRLRLRTFSYTVPQQKEESPTTGNHSDPHRTRQLQQEQEIGIQASASTRYNGDTSAPILDHRPIDDVFENVQRTGFRIIILLPNDISQEWPSIGRAASLAALDQGHHLWVVSGGADTLNLKSTYQMLQDAYNERVMGQFLKGAAYIFPDDGYADFRNVLVQQPTSFFQRLVDVYWKPNLWNQHSNNDDDNHDDGITLQLLESIRDDPTPLQRLAYDELMTWMPGAGFLYDAVMSIGLGACAAIATLPNDKTNNQTTTTMTGPMHLDGIRSLDFVGASGRIRFGGDSSSQNNGTKTNQRGRHYPGSRDADSVQFSIVNFVEGVNQLDNRSTYVPVTTESLDPATGEWIQYAPFIYADGTTNPPKVLRTEPEQNYISKGFQAAGLTLFAIAMATVLASFLWVLKNRDHSVVIAAQPLFLDRLCLGSAMVSLTILLASFDESMGFNEQSLTGVCYAWFWLDALGSTMIYSSLFIKLWRANRCLRYKTNNIAIWKVAWPVALIAFGVISTLMAWTIYGDYGWERFIVDEVTGESVGLCYGESMYYFMGTVIAIHMVPVALAGIMAWKTLGLDEEYAESKWVLALILVQMQVHMVAIPIIAILHQTHPSGRFIGLSLMSFTVPMTTMGLMILPKVFQVRRTRRKAASTRSAASVVSEGSPAPDSARELSNGNHSTRNEHTQQSEGPRLSSGPRIQVVTFD